MTKVIVYAVIIGLRTPLYPQALRSNVFNLTSSQFWLWRLLGRGWERAREVSLASQAPGLGQPRQQQPREERPLQVGQGCEGSCELLRFSI